MKAQEIREMFFEFFRNKGHEIVPSAPMVVKNDPTLMFTNAGMNQFKDIFLGNEQGRYKRVANSQKCLRVSGKHNDLEEVGHDTYHHTMFEMLGNWSFGDYFKQEAIEWAWELLREKFGIPEDRLYATVFEGSADDKVPRDDEAYGYWEKCFSRPEGRIIEGSKKDNFWEMGESGPCGPCSEIHVDIRSDQERAAIPGRELVNKGHPHVIEIWNLVFIQYNRRSDGILEQLPSRHVDTGMGFERLCMVVQGKKSNYETDIFQDVISEISAITGKPYGKNEKWDVALRVIADHLRAVAFSIADGQIPSNNKAGYVIRRILRRAVRYGYTSLGMEEPFIYKLVPVLARTMGSQYRELESSGRHIGMIIHEEESSFLRTLGKGLKMIEKTLTDLKAQNQNVLPGKVAFEMYDTYGFPVDLTQLILKENDMTLDIPGFEKEMKGQKERSREDAATENSDWTIIRDSEGTEFTGYNSTRGDVNITRFRKVRSKGKENWHIVLDKTPFYAESGGQVGDTGILRSGNATVKITDTIKENNLIIHIADSLPPDPSETLRAEVDTVSREKTANNHTATHLLHYALRKVLGKHVEQKGSLVTPERLRFDFSHYSKPSPEELRKIEEIANGMVRGNYESLVSDGITMEKALGMGAMALFGEKYGERVRVVGFGDSVELCGGTHVEATGRIGMIKIVSEGAIAAGIRRIEAVTGSGAEDFINEKLNTLDEIAALVKSSGSLTENVGRLVAEVSSLRKTIEKLQMKSCDDSLRELASKAESRKGISLISGIVESDSQEVLKNSASRLRSSLSNSVIAIGSESAGKASLLLLVTDDLISKRGMNAVSIIREIAGEINGGGGGQPFLASAGGKNPSGLGKALSRVAEIIDSL